MGRWLEACDFSRGVEGCCSGTRVACGITERIGHQFAADTAAATGETELFVAARIF